MKKLVSTLLFTAFLAVSMSAQAALTLNLSTDGVNWTTVNDDGALDAAVGTDVITYVGIGTLSGWNILVSTGLVNDGPPWTLHLDTVASGTGTLYAMLTTTGMDVDENYNVNSSATTDGTVDFTAYIDSSNSTPTSLADLDSLYKLSASGHTTQAGTNGAYSVTVLGKIVHDANGTTSFDHEVEIPTPGTLALLGLGLIGLGFAKRRT